MSVPVLGKLSENKEFIYALALIIFIPAAFIASTVFMVNRLNNDFNTELTAKANLATNIFASAIKDSATDSAKLNQIVNQVSEEESDLSGLTILSFIQNNPVILASNEREEATSSSTILQSKLAWTTGQPYTTKQEVLNEEGKTVRLWQVAYPVKVASRSAAIVNLKVSGEKSDLLIANLVRDSIYFTIGALVVIILLLLNHFRFFGYARNYATLKEVDEMKDNFISLASHELRTPVTALRGFASLALQNLQKNDAKSALGDLDMVNKSADGIASLVNDLLDVSRIEQKRVQLNLADIDLGKLTEEVLAELSAQAQQKQLTLYYQKPPAPIILNVDEQKLKQILVNIIGNSIKYTPKGSVTVGFTLASGAVKISIKDTGLGISAEELPKLFGKFHRVQTDQTRKIRGTGLGLWITKQLVEMMKGKIFVESIEGTGSNFVITFPLKAQK